MQRLSPGQPDITTQIHHICYDSSLEPGQYRLRLVPCQPQGIATNHRRAVGGRTYIPRSHGFRQNCSANLGLIIGALAAENRGMRKCGLG